ncbi:sucrose-6-phosphate hydrolase [Vibrio agarivorans]|uniref:Sucrose-6-phosphate hydrolase n=1 Tax=Vibrio agarivorans TaxID=153622 RepID=A0ABT7Y6J6_9VIBR|nr:sucrose-6-phosphate hydrolase [Vibrio agarivorans]MDN2483667.1 sucrose-6-phosphate hydrolase [Vibrio agarivorans]
MEMNWTVEQRYRRIEEIDSVDIDRMMSASQLDRGYPKYHIAPPFGLLNDPNGLCHFNGEHHVFFQWTPVGPVHGMKYWYHVSTENFVDFIDHGIAIHPDQDFDSHGAYSGGALVENNQALLFYTGNKRDDNWVRVPTQCLASMAADGSIAKQGVIIENSDYTEHFRDPKVWKSNEDYLMVVGAQTQEKKGCMVLYRSKELDNWEHLGPIHTSYNDFGYMWECPDFFELDGQAVMLFSPQGVNSENQYDLKNIFSVTYIVGDRLNIDTVELESHQDILQPDYGFEFYAPQTYLDKQGRRIMIAWVGLPEIDTPSVEHEWAGMLTIPRELRLEDGYLIQKPLAELELLKSDPTEYSSSFELSSTSFCLSFSTDQDNFQIELSNDSGESLSFCANEKQFTLDRSKMTQLYAEDYGTKRYAPRVSTTQNIDIYVDASVIEIFINDGKHTMTSRFFIDDLNSVKVSSGLIVEHTSMKGIEGLYSAR